MTKSYKPYYEEYANHSFRFYVRNPVLNIKDLKPSRVDIENWQVCDDVFGMLTPEEKSIVTGVYRSKCAVPDIVHALSCDLHISEKYIWTLLNRVVRDFAKKRELI